MSSTLYGKGFIQLYSYSMLFTKIEGSSFLAILIYVNDILIASSDDKILTNFKSFLASKFNLRILDLWNTFSELKLPISKGNYYFVSVIMLWNYLKKTGTLGSKPRTSPIDPGLKLSKDTSELLSNPVVYRRWIGKLINLTITQPDLSLLSIN